MTVTKDVQYNMDCIQVMITQIGTKTTRGQAQLGQITKKARHLKVDSDIVKDYLSKQLQQELHTIVAGHISVC